MPNGIVLIDWWVLRLPEMTQIPRQPVMGIVPTSDPRRSTRNDLRISAVHESGGELVAAAWRDGPSWKTEPARIRGRVVESGTRAAPREGAVLILEGSNLETLTKADGSYAMAPVIPGRYTLSVSDTALSDLTDARSVSRSIDLQRGDTITVDFAVPPLAEIVPRACQGTKMQPESSILLGTLLDSVGNVIRDATVTARWLDAADVIGKTLQAHHTERTYQVDDRGRFRFCGVVRERPVALRVERPGLAPAADTTVFAYELIQRMVWRIKAPRR
jgi:hypothetical protein